MEFIFFLYIKFIIVDNMFELILDSFILDNLFLYFLYLFDSKFWYFLNVVIYIWLWICFFILLLEKTLRYIKYYVVVLIVVFL